MLLAGDETGRTQHGNNNSYCQDNEINWINWDLSQGQKDLLTFVQDCVALRQAESALRLDRFPDDSLGENDPWVWFVESGVAKSDEDWSDPERRSFGILLEADQGGHLVILMNAGGEDAAFQLPEAIAGSEDRIELILSSVPDEVTMLTAKPGSVSVYRVPPV